MYRKIGELRRGNAGYPDVWIAPNGDFYDGEAHANRAAEILHHLYGLNTENLGDFEPVDKLEALGWIRASSGYYWGRRLEDRYYLKKELTQAQLSALYDFCQAHGLAYDVADFTQKEKEL